MFSAHSTYGPANGQHKHLQVGPCLPCLHLKPLPAPDISFWTCGSSKWDYPSPFLLLYSQHCASFFSKVNRIRVSCVDCHFTARFQEELAGKRADASHLAVLTADQRDQLEGLKHSLGSTRNQLHTAQSNLSEVCGLLLLSMDRYV